MRSLHKELENDIIFGVYAPGMRITEESVMAQYDVKRHAVRSAFGTLESQGLLIHRANRGVEVVDYTPDDVDALYDLRIVLETAAARRTPLPVASDIILQLEELAAQHAKAVKREDFREVYWLNQSFHELQYSSCENPRLAALIARHARMAQPIRVVKYDDKQHMKDIVTQHLAIIKAMGGNCQETYAQAVRDHLPASAEAYRTLYERRFGSHRALR
ncbi:GntR family transcriptional regulator [Granulosicoccus sp. 3-233]|uniref:GntR family transcriptional regulator n=1 Tax=Granulosicoccus sp. 3-233 TaxID=3417969 RepID=UPI003D32A93A